MKRLLIVICSLTILMTPQLGYAEAMEDYEEAHNIYIAAGASVAAYDERIGKLATGYLEEEGWEIDRYLQQQGNNGARYLLAKKDFGGGKQIYVLAFVGTETVADISFDLKTDKVYFAGNSIEEFASNATQKGVASSEPKVHQGFYEFLQSALTAKALGTNGDPQLLMDILMANKESKLYLVGHSLGGAVATLAGAGLINMGVQPEQIEVITFGAPAVGNAAFVAKFDPLLKLTRVVISGDPVTGLFQTLVGGYKQFGKEIRWTLRDHSDQHHKIAEYVDLTLKNYYDKREEVIQAGISLPVSRSTQNESYQHIYIAPFKNNLPKSLEKEFWYMSQALREKYSKKLPGCIIATDGDKDNWREKAAAAGYQWVVVPEVDATRVRQEHNIYYITFNQTVYEVATGGIVELASLATGTYTLTPLEAFIHDFKGINNTKSNWIN